MPYEFLDEIAIADVAFRAWGGSLEEVFAAAAAATLEVMIENPASVQPRATVNIDLRDTSADMLLFNFLQELIWYKDARQLLLRIAEIKIATGPREIALAARAAGETIEPGRHHLVVDVKAVTLHHFTLSPTPAGWECRIILDI